MWNYPQAVIVFYKENLKRFGSETLATIAFGSVPNVERNGSDSAIETAPKYI
jgi:hypothetical protein